MNENKYFEGEIKKVHTKRGRPFLPEEKQSIYRSFRIPKVLNLKLESYCKQHGNITVSDVIRESINLYLNDRLEVK